MPTLNLEQLKAATQSGGITDTTLGELKAAAQAAQAEADYDRWFRAKAQASIDGLKDGSNRVYNQEEWKTMRADMIARIRARQNA